MAFIYWISAPHHTDMFTQGYIGYTSKTVKERFKQHVKVAKSKSKKKHIIHKAILKYSDTLKVTTVLEGSEEYCLFMEEKLRPNEFIGWNQIPGGTKPPSGFGRAKSKATTEKLWTTRRKNLEGETEEARLARLASYAKWTDESKARFSEQRKGIKFSESHIENMRLCKLGTKMSEETKAKMRLSNKSILGDLPPWGHYQANKEMWVLSEKVFDILQRKPSITCGKVEKECGVVYQKLSAIFKKIKSGWNPSLDPAYLEWLASYKLKQEAHNGP